MLVQDQVGGFRGEVSWAARPTKFEPRRRALRSGRAASVAVSAARWSASAPQVHAAAARIATAAVRAATSPTGRGTQDNSLCSKGCACRFKKSPMRPGCSGCPRPVGWVNGKGAVRLDVDPRNRCW